MAASSLASSSRLSSRVKNKRWVEAAGTSSCTSAKNFARGIDGAAGVQEPGIGREPPEKIIERLIALHRLGERGAGVGSFGERRELALVGLLEGEAFGSATLEIALHLRIIEPGIEIGESPFRQHTEAARATRDRRRCALP